MRCKEVEARFDLADCTKSMTPVHAEGRRRAGPGRARAATPAMPDAKRRRVGGAGRLRWWPSGFGTTLGTA